MFIPRWVYEMGDMHWHPDNDDGRKIDDQVIRELWEDLATTLSIDSSDFMRLIDKKYTQTVYVNRISWDPLHTSSPPEAYPGFQGILLHIRADHNNPFRPDFIIYRIYPYVQRRGRAIVLDLVVQKEYVDP